MSDIQQQLTAVATQAVAALLLHQLELISNSTNIPVSVLCSYTNMQVPEVQVPEKKKRAPPKKKEKDMAVVVAPEVEATAEAVEATAVATEVEATGVPEKKKRAPPKKKEKETVEAAAVEGEVEVPEKKKRAPPKKKETVEASAVVAETEVPEKKKRAPPKKKETVEAAAVEGEVEVPENKKRAPPKKKETVEAAAVEGEAEVPEKKKRAPPKKKAESEKKVVSSVVSLGSDDESESDDSTVMMPQTCERKRPDVFMVSHRINVERVEIDGISYLIGENGVAYHESTKRMVGKYDSEQNTIRNLMDSEYNEYYGSDDEDDEDECPALSDSE